MVVNNLMDRLPRQLKMRELRVLLTVIEHGSFRKAATALHITQPAVTKAIADLETMLGVKLFDRNAAGAEPTIYGQSFARHAGAIFGEMRSAAEELDIISSGAKGTLHIGAVPMPASGILPVAIKRMLVEHPSILVSVVEGSEAVLAEGLRRRELDIVLSRLALFGGGEDLRFEALFEDSLCVLAAKDHPLAKRRRLTWDELLTNSWVMPPEDSFFSHHIHRVLNKRGFEVPRVAVKSISIHIMYGMLVHAGMLTFATQSQFAFSPMKNVLVQLPIVLPPVTASIGAVSLRARQQNPLAEKLIAHVRALSATV